MKTDISRIDLLAEEYKIWLYANIDKEYIEEQCCSADSILWDSIDLKLNEDQKLWLRKFITRWDKAYL
tara:strand:+ start:875 stop:1078 length:204 start_codon:yes stop_codon:yes gene_type:complete